MNAGQGGIVHGEHRGGVQLDTPRQAHSAFITLITPETGWMGVDLRELWSHRELVWFLA
jgi:hypothetical protein